jgi:hypothetical protein
MAICLARIPGSYTAMFKVLKGVTPSSWSSTVTGAARAKNVLTYEPIGEAVDGAVIDGKTVGGEYIDIMHGTYWNRARIAERILSALLNAEKLPFDDRGIGAIEGEMRAGVKEAQDAGLYTLDPAPSYTVPKRSETSPADRGLRSLKGLGFRATYAGAIHFVEVRGVATL